MLKTAAKQQFRIWKPDKMVLFWHLGEPMISGSAKLRRLFRCGLIFFGLHIVHTRFATWTGINHVSKLKERYHTHQPRTTKMRKTFNYIYIYTYTVHIKTFPLNAGQYCNFTIERRGDEKAAKTTMLMLSRSWSSKLGYLKISFHISHSQQPQQFETVGWFPWWSSIHHTLITPCCWACKTVLFSSMDNHLRRAMAHYDFQRSCKYPSLWLVSLPVTIGN